MVDEGVSREEIAVFYRTNAQSRVLEDMLVRAQIGYQVIGGTKFYERAEIRDAVAYLTFLANPQDARRVHARRQLAQARARADVALARAPPRGHDGHPGVGGRGGSRRPCPALGTAAQKALGRFMSTMVRLRERVESGAPVGDLLDELLRETGYLDALEAERTIEAQGRIENLEELVRRRARVRRDSPSRARVGEFLQQIALIADVDSLRDDEGLVTLMTLHNAKGLEFPIVFMIGMEDGIFPHSRALDEGDIEEERRLAYVGLTRAMRDLTLTYARRRNSFGGPVLRHALALHRRDPARADRPGGQAGGRRRLGARAASPRGRTPRPPPPRPHARHRGRRLPRSATTSSTPRSARAW